MSKTALRYMTSAMSDICKPYKDVTMDDTTTQDQPQADTLADQINQLAVGHVAALEDKLRGELQKEQEEQISRAVDDALAFHAPQMFGKDNDNQSGFMPLDGDHSLASKAQFLMSEHWSPVPVGADKNITQENVERAIVEFLSGAPLSRQLIGSDEESSVLIGVMESCEQKYKLDPHARSIIDNMTNYTIGTGVEFGCTVDEIDDELKTFAMRNNLRKRVKEAARRKYKMGEHYFFYYIDKSNGDIYIRDRTKAHEIKAIHTHPDDAETRLAYGRGAAVVDPRTKRHGNEPKLQYFADINYWEQRQKPGGEIARGVGRLSREKLVQMVKIGDASEVRGTPILYPALRYLRYYEDFILDRIVLNHERSKVVWVRKVSGNRNMPGGRAQRGPVGGQILTETPQLEWRVVNPEIHGDDAMPDGRLIRMAIASSVNVPEHVLFQDPSNQVYASIRQQDTPFSYHIRSHQQDWIDDMRIMFRTVIREKVAAGELSPTSEVEVFTTESTDKLYGEVAPMIQENAKRSEIWRTIETIADESPTKTMTIDSVDVPLDVSLPDVVQEDGLKMAQTSEVLDRIGILSKTELSARHGYNYKRTALLKSVEGDWVQDDEETPEGDGNRGRSTFGKNGSNENEPDKPKED